MEDNLREPEAGRQTKFGLLVRGILVVSALFLALGCEETQKRSEAPTLTGPSETSGLTAQAYRIILEGLNDTNPFIRVKAIEVVAETGQIKLMPKVQRLAGDEFAPVRFAAALAIGDMEYSFGASAIKQLLRDKDLNVKIAASYAMVRLGSPRYVEVLRRAIASKDQTVRANAAFLLGKCGDKEALKLLYWALQDKDSEDKVVYQAAESIAMLQDDRIYPKLWTMLISAYADVRVTGIKAMGTLGTPEARNALITMLDDKVLEVRLAAAGQLGKLGDKTGEPEVLDVFRRNLTAGMEATDRARVNILAALAIGQIATPSLREYLPQLLSDESKTVRMAAAAAVLRSRIKD